MHGRINGFEKRPNLHIRRQSLELIGQVPEPLLAGTKLLPERWRGLMLQMQETANTRRILIGREISRASVRSCKEGNAVAAG